MEKKNKIKLWIIGGVVLLIVIACVIYLTRKPEVSTVYETSTVKYGVISNYITATGTVEPVTQVEVGTQVSGTIDKIFVDYNSEVKKGDLLAEIDRTALEATLTSMQSEFEANKASWEYQQKNFERIQELYEQKAISDSEFETAEYDYKRARYAYEKSISSVNTAKINLGYTRIYSPIDGVVLSKAVDEGQTVAASFNTPTLFTIANDLSKMQVIANVDEADIGQVKTGQKVTFTVDAFPDDTFEGEVLQVRLEATTTSNVVTYSVVIDAPNLDLKLMPGLTANVMVQTKYKDSILVIPSKALRFTPESSPSAEKQVEHEKIQIPDMKNLNPNQKVVWIKNTDDEILPRIIETGERDAINYEVKTGLQENDEVVLSVSQVTGKTGNGESTNGQSPFMPARPGRR